MLIEQLRQLVNALPPECDKMPAMVATSVHGQRVFDLIVQIGILPIPESPAAVLVTKTEYDRMVAEGKATPYPEYEPPKPQDDILPGDEWKLG
jgi:hypothetical protein